jgi:hypothetical protein
MRNLRRAVLTITILGLSSGMVHAMSDHWNDFHGADNWYTCTATIETPQPADRSVEVNIYSPTGEWIAHAANNYSNGNIIQASVGIAPNGVSGTFRCVATFQEDSEVDNWTVYAVVP